MSSIILTADDYGACDFIDNGIIRALRDKKINTVTAFVTHPDSKSRLQTLITLREELKQQNNNVYTFNIGLHFSLTSGTAITGKSSLTDDESGDDGKFEFHEAKNYPFRKIKHEDLQHELTAQLNLLDEWLGNTPIDHVTNHHGICYLDLGFFEEYVKTINLFKSKKLNNKLPIRSPMSWLKSDMKTWKNGKVLIPTIKQGIELGFWKKVGDVTNKKLRIREEHAFALEINYPIFLADTIYGLPHEENIKFLLEQLAPKNYSAEFMFHLGHPGREVANMQKTIDDLIMPHGIDRGYFLNRTEELKALSSLPLDSLLQQHNIQKIYFAEA
ncbi:MAG: ChbG/HpnK family deacetylase [Sphingobacteriaceae bacterium]|nr:ChbG/HpnK family deacetylase [Sphingobacteriaceae bacterium]